MSDVFDQIGSAEVYESSAYIMPGVCAVAWVERLKMQRSRAGDNLFIGELDIIEGNEANPSGTSAAYFVNMKYDSGPGNVRRALAQIAGIQPDDVDGNGARLAVSDQNPLNGTLVKITAHNTKTRAGKDFTVVNFEKLPEELQAKAKELHRAAGF